MSNKTTKMRRVSDNLNSLVRSWVLFAEAYGDDLYMHFGERRYVEMCGGGDSITEVTITESEDGKYWGWLEYGEDVPCMIWHSRCQFSMCFTYGPDVEVEKGRGEIIRFNCRQNDLA